MKPDLLDSLFDRGWMGFAFDGETTWVLFSRDNTCVQIRGDLLAEGPPEEGSTQLREYAAGLKT